MALLWTDLREIKAILQIDPNDTSEDNVLNLMNEWVADWFGNILNRPDFALQYRNEYKKGTGTQKLTLGYRPVIFTPQFPLVVLEDTGGGGNFGSTSGAFGNSTVLTYGVDYCLQIDQPVIITPPLSGQLPNTGANNTLGPNVSMCGILLRINNFWLRPFYRQPGLLSPFRGDDQGSYNVSYYGGYTVDTLPAQLRMAADACVAHLRYYFPLGVGLTSDSYEARSIGLAAQRDDYLLNEIRPMILTYRNWKF